MRQIALAFLLILTAGSFVKAEQTPEQGSSEITPNQRRRLEEQQVAQKTTPSIPADAAKPAIHVDTLVFATGVQNHEPEGAASEFNVSVGKVYCWTHLSAPQAPIHVNHVWYLNGAKMAAIPLALQSSSGRTWSAKTVAAGTWKVDVTDDAGTVLSSGSLTVK